MNDATLLRQWDEQPHVIASDPSDDWQWESEVQHVADWREPFIIEVDGRPVGFVDISDPAHIAFMSGSDLSFSNTAASATTIAVFIASRAGTCSAAPVNP